MDPNSPASADATTQPVPLTPEGVRVLAELSYFVGRGVEEAAAGKVCRLEDAARDFWVDRHIRTVAVALARAASNQQTFSDHRAVVTEQASRLGRRAVELALAAAPTAEVIVVTKAHVEVATAQINAEATCRAARIAGGGGYCEG